MSSAETIDQVRENMARACRQAGRKPDEVKLIAVAKYVEPARIEEAFACGLKAVGGEPRPGGPGKVNFL